MFAPLHELGYDTTMRRVEVADGANATRGPQYDIALFSSAKAAPVWFRTQKIISNIGAEPARGRGTRVWQVKELDKTGIPFGRSKVLKDCWIDADRTREGVILEEIRQSATPGTPQRQALDKYFLTVRCHGDVYIEQEQDHTFTLLRRKQEIPQDAGRYRLEVQPTQERFEDRLLPVGPLPLLQRTADGEQIVEYDDKAHCRIVFEEQGETIDKQTSASEVFRLLTATLKGE